MTKKRFTHQRTDDYNFSDILDDGKWIGICHVDCEDDFVDKFNELAEENEELKKRDDLVLSYLQDEGSITLEKYNEIVDYLYKEWKKERNLE